MKVKINYCDNNILNFDVKQLNKIMKLYTLKALWNDQGKMKMYYGMSRVKMQLSGKRTIALLKHLLYLMKNCNHRCEIAKLTHSP